MVMVVVMVVVMVDDDDVYAIFMMCTMIPVGLISISLFFSGVDEL